MNYFMAELGRERHRELLEEAAGWRRASAAATAKRPGVSVPGWVAGLSMTRRSPRPAVRAQQVHCSRAAAAGAC